ncbi:uncharacterized protein LOC135467040 [Liolophura sinensis]|uniref:uncharacterized protein LOC135467040 n=1 Tax=Liolophura sinensis TaxID=3198878 RepID=UPI00315828EC
MFKTEPSSLHVKPLTVCQYLVAAEEKVWGYGMVETENSYSQESQTSDVGNQILRHGTAGRKIHDYFSNLEARKCCLKLRLEARKTTFTNIRLVRHDGRDSGIEEGAMMKTPVEYRANVSQLDSSNFRVFKRAYMCAAFPVLGAPDPPSAFTPSPVQTPTTQRFNYSGILSISRPMTPHSIPDSGLEEFEEDTTSLIPSETLCELLKRAFRLSDEKFTHYERSISESYGKLTQQKVLAEELVNQLAALENNSNPFYNPHSFKDEDWESRMESIRKGYDLWQHQERAHLTQLINKFWHFSLPSPGANFNAELFGVHEDYRKLLAKLIRYENPYKSEREELGPTPASSLSSASVRLLREFGLRYGVGEQYRKFIYLHYLAQHFDATVWYIQHVTMTLKNIMDWLPSNRNHLSITQQEFGIIESSLHLLLGQAGNAISKMKRLFPHNRPTDGVASLIDLLGMSLSLKSYLSMKPTKPLQECLRKYVQESLVTAYERHKLLAMAELQQSSRFIQLCPKLLNILIVNIRDEVSDYRTNYQSTFERYFNITESAAQAFYSFLMEDVLHLCRSVMESMITPEIDLLMLSLGYRLNSLDHDWARYIPPESQRWRESFVTLAVQWTIALQSHVPLLVLEGVGGDKFKSLCLPDCLQSPTNSNSCQRGRSTSLRSLSASVRSAFSSVSSTRSTPVQVGKESQNIPHCDGPGRFVNKQPPIMETSCETGAPGQVEGDVSKRLPHSLGLPTNWEAGKPSPRRPSTHSVDATIFRHNLFICESQDLDDEVVSFTRRNLRPSNSMPNLIANHTSFMNLLQPSTEDPKLSSQNFRYNTNISNQNSAVEMGNVHLVPSIKVVGSTPVEERNFPILERDNQESFTSDEEELAAAYPSVVVVKSHSAGLGFQSVTDKHIPHIEAEIGERVDVTAPYIKPGTSQSKGLIRVPSAPVMSPLPVSLMDQSHVTRQHSDEVDVHSPFLERQKRDSESHEFIDSLKSDFTSISMPTQRSVEFQMVIAPISSSLVDLLVILQRVVGVARTFCDTICPVTNETGLHRHGYWDSMSSSSEDLEDMAYCQDNASARCQLFLIFTKMVCDSVGMFTDNMLCMDLCGLNLSVAKRLVGPKLVECVQVQRNGGLLWGCRHDVPGAAHDCFYFVGRKAFLLCDRHEPISEEMCTRINNVVASLEFLKKYFENVCTIFGIHDNNDVSNFLSDTNTEETGYESCLVGDLSSDFVVIDSYYDLEYDQLPYLEASSLFSTPRATPVQGMKVPIFPVVHCWRHIMSGLSGMCRMLAYRLNLFVRDALALLLSPDMPLHQLSERLKPILDFLSDNLSALSNWLYRDPFTRVLHYVWLYIVQDFEEEVSKLKTGNFNTEKQAELLTHAMSYLIRFMNNMGKGVHLDQLLAYSEDVSFKLQLYTLTTALVCLLYENLVHYVSVRIWNTIFGLHLLFSLVQLFQYSIFSECSSNNDDIPHGMLRQMKLELQSRRKCFSGRQLVSWLLRNQEKSFLTGHGEFGNTGDPETGHPMVSRDLARQVAQKLFKQGIIVDVEQDSSVSGRTHTSSMMSDETPYPDISIHSDLQDLSLGRDTHSQRTRNSDSMSTRSRSSSTTTIQDTYSVAEVSSISDEFRNKELFQPEMAGNGSRESGETPGGRDVKEDNCFPSQDKNKCEHDTRLNHCDNCKEKDMDKETKDNLPKSTQLCADNVIVDVDGTGHAEETKTSDNIQTSGTTTNSEIGHLDDQARSIKDVGGSNTKEVTDKISGGEQCQSHPEQPKTATNRTPQSSISQDTGSWATSHSSCAVFQDTPKKFYMFNPEGEDFKNLGYGPNDMTTGTQGVSRVRRELLGMVETCFHKKITPDYILLILFARRKYDPTAKTFFKNVPEDTLNRLLSQVDAHCCPCTSS